MNCSLFNLIPFASFMLVRCSQKSEIEKLPLRIDLIQNHPYNCILRLNNHYQDIDCGRYYDPYGNGNCLFHSLIFAIYPELNDDFSEIRRKFLNLDYFNIVDENIISLRQMEKLRARLLKILDQKNKFDKLTYQELEVFVEYIRKIIYACIQKNYIEKGFVPDDITENEDLNLIFTENYYGSDEDAIHFANFLSAHIRIYYASNDINLHDARIQNGISNFETAKQSAKLLPFYIYIIRMNEHFQVVENENE